MLHTRGDVVSQQSTALIPEMHPILRQQP
ncbi:uncharacterized protein METZ01_LOCUS308555, partial [marine metagenome]